MISGKTGTYSMCRYIVSHSHLMLLEKGAYKVVDLNPRQLTVAAVVSAHDLQVQSH